MKIVSNLSNQLLNASSRVNATIEFNPEKLPDDVLCKLREASDLIDEAAASAKQAADMIGHTRVS